MANPIKFNELFDDLNPRELELLIKVVTGLDGAVDKLAETLTQDGKRIKDGLSAITADTQELAAGLKNLGVTNETARKKIKEVNDQLEKNLRTQKDFNDALKGNEAAQKLAADSVEGFRARIKELNAEYTRLSASQDKIKMQELAAQIRETRAQADALTLATRKVNSEFTAATGSYNDLVNQNKKLNLELKNMGDGFDAASPRVRELKDQIYQNTQRLKDFDKELNQTYRNVGNYAEGIIQAAEHLRKNKSALEAQVEALRKQADANRHNVDLQNQIQTELRQTNNELYQVNQQLKTYGANQVTADGITQGVTKNLKGYATSLLGAYVGLQALQEASTFIIKTNYELSDSVADIQKTTGLSQAAVRGMAEDFAKIDTRTALKELLNISKIGGTLGVAGKDIGEFTNAIDKAVVALGDEFTGGAEQIATELGKIDNIFKVSTESGKGLGAALTNIGSAVNELCASGAATGPFLTDFALRVGAIAKGAGVGLGSVLGYGAALEELGFSAEVSGTAFNKLVGGLAGKSKQFYEVAKLGNINLSLKEFTKTINTDSDKAIKLFLAGLNAGGSSTTQFTELLQSLNIKGAASSAVITALAQNMELVEKRQNIANKQLTDGQSLLAEFNIKNDTLAASIDKLKNGFTNLVGSGELQDFLKSAIDGFLAFAAGAKLLYKGVTENKDVIVASVPIFAAFRVASTGAAVSQVGLAASIGLTRMNLLRTMVTMRAAWATMLANPIGLVLLGISALVIGFNRLSESSERNQALTRITDRVNKDLDIALKQVAESQGKLSAQIENFNTLSPKQQENLRREIVLQKQLAIAKLEQVEAQRKDAEKKALEINTYDKLKAAALSFGNGVLYSAILMSDQVERLGEVQETTGDKIKQLKEEIGKYDDQLIQANGKLIQSTLDQAEATKKAADAQRKGNRDLEKFRLEQQAAALQEYANNEKNAMSERLKALGQERVLLARVADLERIDALDKENLTVQEQLLIREQYRAKLKELGNEQSADALAIRKRTLDLLGELDKLEIEAEIKKLDALAANEFTSYEGRQVAVNEAARLRIKVLELEKEAAIRNSSGGKLEIERIEKEHVAKVNEIRAGLKNFDSTKANDDLERTQKEQLLALAKQRAEGLISEKTYEQAKIDLSDKTARARIENLKKEYGYNEQALTEDLALWEKNAEKKTEKDKEETEKRKRIREEAEALAQEALEAGLQLGSDLLEANQEAALNRLEEQKQAELALAGDNAAARQAIEEQYAKKQSDLKKKQAKQDKLFALLDVALNTGVAVAKAVAESPTTFGLPWSAFALANGAIQAALILAKPIPEFWTGTDNAPAGPAWLAERGPELVASPSGNVTLVTGKQVGVLEGGSQVIPAGRTAKILEQIDRTPDQAQASFNKNSETLAKLQTGRNSLQKIQEVITVASARDADRIINAINSKDAVRINFTKDGLKFEIEKNGVWTDYANKYYNR